MVSRLPEEPTTAEEDQGDGTESRRGFLKLLAACSATCGMGCMEGPGPDEPWEPGDGPPPITGPISAGNVSDLPEEGLQIVPGWPLAIGRDHLGLWALTLACTHLGCNIGDTSIPGSLVDYERGLECGCHGSHYSIDGELLRPPATRNLRNYPVSIDEDGEISIDTSGEVESGTRTPVPETFA